jgi:NADPH2:quinone reductase
MQVCSHEQFADRAGPAVKAIHVVPGEPHNRLCCVSVDEPDSSTLVLIAVEVAGVAQPDILQIFGQYQNSRPMPFVPGTEVIGTVLSAPPGSEELVGRRVTAITPEGAWQQRVAVPVPFVFAVPADVSASQASLLLVNYVAAHFALVLRGSARSGETLVVHGAAGGIGGAAVQVGAALGLRTIAVTSTAEKADYARSLGAAEVVPTERWKATVDELVGAAGVDMVFDPVAGDRFDDSLRVLKPGGRLLVIGFLGGEIPQVKINRLLLRNVSLVGVATGAYMQHDPAQLTRTWGALCELLTTDRLQLPDATTFPLSKVDDAVAAVRDRRAVGKVALTMA